MKLTPRNKKLILLLLEEDNYITVRYIAETVKVSSRTVLRELIPIENWLNSKGIALEKKKGSGIRISLKDKEREALKSEIKSEKSNLVYSPEQRLTLLKAELLKNPGITKLYTLTMLLEVTEGTISADLDKLDTWMDKFRLKINKKPGLGVYVEGNEISVRSAIITLIYDQVHEAELINIIFNKAKEAFNLELIKTRINQGILDIIDVNNLILAEQLLKKVETQMGCQFADNSYIALVIRISVTIHRCFIGMFIHDIDEQVKAVPEDKLYNLVKEWFISHENPLSYAVPEEEIKYLVIHIKGAEIQERQGMDSGQDRQDLEIMELTKEVIYIAERETGIYLEDNEKLLKGLAGHLKMAIYRIRMHLDIMNPLLEDIKDMYPDLFQTAGKCAQFIEEREGVAIPEDEVAYLATHIGAAVKEEKSNTLQIYRAVVVCTNDIGAAQLLVSEIERVFPGIRISSIISVMDMDIAQLTQKHIDLIIATVELQITKLPFILVNPILNEADKRHIRDVLDNFLPVNVNYGRIRTAQFKEKLNKLKQYSRYILQIIDNFLFIEQVAAENEEMLSHFVSRSLAVSGADRFQMEKNMENKEQKGSAILSRKRMVLYHLRSEAVREPGMAVLRLKSSIGSIGKDGNIQKADTFIFLSMPVDTEGCVLELINEITRKIISSDFSLTLKQSGREEIIIELNAILDNFIQSKVLDANIK
ncbi:mannitol operon transcriptional antiterminator [Anaerocolumna jejuensis DSM 15929]|uniref:Mannitol operon transcriptional antiterminator n=1 Tax=Anaerocolumna jejuensis DSM 15929 TaxID=1121322 RepID=A0A1M6NUR2_9FIRM|nr:BglG family transcription antiterminator [Anaerocolumna jejuensis]SHJ99368.1 mannitol operon transcriptional antiterminator [Anaerocolumna jejuensis DSM 15929]